MAFFSRVKPVASINRSALVMHSAAHMYALVNDVQRYPEFLDGCSKVDLIESSATAMSARLHLSKAGLSFQFVTRNTLLADEKITLELQDGPFDYLRGSWVFTRLKDDACKVEMALEFGVTGLKGKALSGLFSPIAGSMVDAFCKRADNIYK
jgi:ribosome-associated toxin RatA of RatAB toxin-antitoxin module